EQVATAMRSFRIGDTLMEERQRVTEQTREILSAHARRLSELESPSARRRHRTGRALILLLAQLMCLAWERISRRGILPHGATGIRRKWLLAFLAVLTVALVLAGRALCASQPLLPMWLLPYLLPLSAAAILAALFADGATGLAAALWLGLACDMLFGKNGGVAIPAFAASASAVLVLRRVHKRSQIMRAGLLSGAVAALVAAAYAVMQRLPGEAAAAQAVSALAGGFLSGSIATLLLPACEWMFGFTTGVTFLELTDAGHPLLRRLAVEAPGTYHHSLMVAALASAAAEKIGADSLEVTVEAYFHDIGKLAKPEFFTENQRGGDNPHDQLAPAMSALIIQSHVKEGLSLAKRYRLPAVVRQAIASHHGTGLASFFYQIAKKEADAAGLPEAPGLEASFRYEGPRPRTKEHAILMLADGVEAASRSLEKPTPQHIRTLVERMASARIADGQLDESPLSLKEIREIRESLVFSLWNMRHGRTPYPPRHPDRAAKNA
ncbi:MAG: HDIG domain-containing protein, partial [Kiritimatiellae bacterium]|nr:HDIG domain-containing protein [Kiritimatiellia bacterium]